MIETIKKVEYRTSDGRVFKDIVSAKEHDKEINSFDYEINEKLEDSNYWNYCEEAILLGNHEDLKGFFVENSDMILKLYGIMEDETKTP